MNTVKANKQIHHLFPLAIWSAFLIIRFAGSPGGFGLRDLGEILLITGLMVIIYGIGYLAVIKALKKSFLLALLSAIFTPPIVGFIALNLLSFATGTGFLVGPGGLAPESFLPLLVASFATTVISLYLILVLIAIWLGPRKRK